MRYPKANLEKVERAVAPIELGQAEVLEWGDDAMLRRLRHPVRRPASRRPRRCAQEGLDVGVINARFCKPLDRDTSCAPSRRRRWSSRSRKARSKAASAARVLEAANAAGLDTRNVVRLGIPDRFVEHGERGELLADLGLDVAGLCATVRRAPGRESGRGPGCRRRAKNGVVGAMRREVTMRFYVLGNPNKPGVREEAERLLPRLEQFGEIVVFDLDRRPTLVARMPTSR